jgi:hypothetical protein
MKQTIVPPPVRTAQMLKKIFACLRQDSQSCVITFSETVVQFQRVNLWPSARIKLTREQFSFKDPWIDSSGSRSCLRQLFIPHPTSKRRGWPGAARAIPCRCLLALSVDYVTMVAFRISKQVNHETRQNLDLGKGIEIEPSKLFKALLHLGTLLFAEPFDRVVGANLMEWFAILREEIL